MRAVSYVATFIGGAIVCFLLFSIGIVDRVDGVPGTQMEPILSLPTYLSFISVVLTAVTAVLTAVAIGIGLVAAITFRGLKEEAKFAAVQISKTTALEVTNDALSEVKVRAMVVELHAKAEKEIQQQNEWPDDPGENEER